MSKVKIYHGNALDVLKRMRDESVHCVVTSPPYWAQRVYKTQPQVWDGDSDCVHEWRLERTSRPNQSGGKMSENNEYAKKLATKGTDNYSESVDYNDRATYSDFCAKCGAWRGELGSEPTIALFIKHLVSIFTEVRRVLRSDGVCFANMGDNYNAGRNGGHAGGSKQNHSKYQQRSGVNAQGLKPKDLCLIPQRFAIALQDDGWWVRSTFAWIKANCLPESVKDRFSTAHEWMLMLTKGGKYYFDMDAVRVNPTQASVKREAYARSVKKEDKGQPVGKDRIDDGKMYASGINDLPYILNPKGRNRRTSDAFNETLAHLIDVAQSGGLLIGEDGTPHVMKVNPKGFKGAHFAVFPQALVEPLIKCGCPKDGIVLDPFGGAGTVALVASKLERDSVLIELQDEYVDMAYERVANAMPMFTQVEVI